MSGRNKNDKDNNEDTDIMREDLLGSFLELENKRIEIEKQREENIAKELEYSAKSSEDAKEIASEELNVQHQYLQNTWKFRNRIILFIFIIVIVLIVVFTLLTLVLSTDNNELLAKIYAFAIDALKIAGGFVVGYLLKSARKNHKKEREQE